MDKITENNGDLKKGIDDVMEFLSDNIPLTSSQSTVLPHQVSHSADSSTYEGTSGYAYEDNYLYQDEDMWHSSFRHWQYSPSRNFTYSGSLSSPRRYPTSSPIQDISHVQSSITRPRVTPQERTTPSLPAASTSSSAFTAKFLADVKEMSSSQYNFAVNLVRECFDEDTRKVSNMAGK